MNPITLRLPEELLTELESEAEDHGYSSRAEYIRHILQNRSDEYPVLSDNEIPEVDSKIVASNTEEIEDIQSELGDVTLQIQALESRVEALAEKLDRDEESAKGKIEDSGPMSVAPIDELNSWLEQHGPQSDDAVAIIRKAAEILYQEGPLRAGKIKKQLHAEFPEAYSSEDTLWGSTVDRVYDDAPGFNKPEYGKYDFEM